MHTLISITMRWLGRHILNLLLIIGVLVAGRYAIQELNRYWSSKQTLEVIQAGEQQLPAISEELHKGAENRTKELKTASRSQLQSRIHEIDLRLADLNRSRRSELERKMGLVDGSFPSDFRNDVETDLLLKERQYIEGMLAFDSLSLQIEGVRKAHKKIWDQLQANLAQQAFIREQHPILHRTPFSDPNSQLHLLAEKETDLRQENELAYQRWLSMKKSIDSIKKREIEFESAVDQTQRKWSGVISQEKGKKADERDNNVVGKFIEMAMHELVIALSILVSIIFSPVLIKGLFYYVLAPLASKRIRLVVSPEVSGAVSGIDNSGSPIQSGACSGKSISVTPSIDEELLIHPEFIRTMADAPTKETKFVLNNRLLLTSFAAGMFSLTRLAGDGKSSYTLATKDEPFIELALLSIPAGSGFVIYPRYLVGVIHPKNQPPVITSRWFLGSPAAWLRLQFRYLVIHGPVKLVVKGCQGVRVEAAGQGSSINQANVIGFSGNLAHSVTRCEPFIPYLQGKQDLYNDHFSDADGYYVYEELAYGGKKGGIFGKGLEGLVDSLLKLAGI